MDDYGSDIKLETHNEIELAMEELQRVGFTIIENVLTTQQIKIAKDKLRIMYENQKAEACLETSILEKIGENDVIRCPLLQDDYFIQIAAQTKIVKIMRSLLGEYCILNQQNGVIVPPHIRTHAHDWHRDFPQQEFVVSKPLGISALFCIDDFYPENGSTVVLPYSHQFSTLPSQQFINKYKHSTAASAGSAILFDCMLFHAAGYNQTNEFRFGLNHIYSSFLLKQQIDLPRLLIDKYQNNPELMRLIGYESQACVSAEDYRKRRYMRNINRAILHGQ